MFFLCKIGIVAVVAHLAKSNIAFYVGNRACVSVECKAPLSHSGIHPIAPIAFPEGPERLRRREAGDEGR